METRDFSAADLSSHPVIFFDGVCGLCNRFVDWVISRDRLRRFRFSPLQGETARQCLPPASIQVAEELRSVLLLDPAGVHQKSTAVLRVLGYLGGPWKLLLVFRLVPRALRDWAYDYLAAHRYQWFGKHETCRLPTPEERALFLE